MCLKNKFKNFLIKDSFFLKKNSKKKRVPFVITETQRSQKKNVHDAFFVGLHGINATRDEFLFRKTASSDGCENQEANGIRG